MKILVLLPESPFPWASTASRYYGPMLKALDLLGHEVSVLYVANGVRGSHQPARYFEGTSIAFTAVDPPAARPPLERKIRSAWRSEWELAASDFGRQARHLASRGVNVVLAEHPSTARAVEGLRNAVCSLQCLRHVDLQSGGSLANRRRSVQTRRAERTTLERTGRVRVVSRRLADLTRALVPGARISVVPLCLDATLYEPVAPAPVPTIGFIGSMFWEPSRAAARRFVKRIVPRIRREMGEARFVVAGWDATRYLAADAAEAGVELVENFSDAREAFSRLSVLVNAPPVGTGMKVKVLEAMAYGVPVVANDDGAEGLEWIDRSPVCLANDDDQIATAAMRLAGDPQECERLATAGRECVEHAFAPAAVASRLVTELMRLVTPGLIVAGALGAP
jgi:glycosyltransferase involved in cell wall biosynthesis